MSFLPALFTDRAGAEDGGVLGRHPVVHIKGDMELAQQRWAQFANAYVAYADSTGRHTVHRSPTRKFAFPSGDTMHIIAQGETDYVTVTVAGGKTSRASTLEGFLITPMNADMTGPDRAKAGLFAFGFDATKFAYSAVPNFVAGNLRRGDVSWDSTGGGDLAHEAEKLSDAISSSYLQNPNAYAAPYAAMSGDLYSGGKSYHVLDGTIHGMRISGDTILLADFSDTRTVRIHQAGISRDASGDIQDILYTRVLGSAKVPLKGLVNFSTDLKSCVVLSTVVKIEGPFAADKVFTTSQIIPGETANKIVRAGYKSNNLRFTLTATMGAGGMTNFCPHDFSEYALPWDNNPDGYVTHGHRTEVRSYYEISYKLNWSLDGVSPDWQRKYEQDRLCTIIKKPIIVFQGMYPTTAYTWMRTVSQMSVSDENKLYWYKDYESDDYVRCAWSIGYVATQNYEQYGAFEPDESDVVSGRAISVGGVENEVAWANVLTGTLAASNWFYAVTNGKGDFVLRTEPNGTRADALLISRKGVTKRIKDTYSVGII